MFRLLNQATKLSSSLFQESLKLENYQKTLLAKTNQKYDRSKAFSMACLAKLAYQEDVTVIENIINNNQRLLQPISEYLTHLKIESLKRDSSNPCGFILTTPSKIFIAIRGTKTREDILFDSLCRKNQDELHLGFNLYVDQIWNSLETILNNKYNKNKTIILTGHSLGGAVASVITYRLSKRRDHLKIFSPLETFTFGAPRISTQKIIFETSLWRFRLAGDLIPYLPPNFLKYTHFEPEYLLNHSYEIYQLDESPESNHLRWYEFLKIVAQKIEIHDFPKIINLLRQYQNLETLVNTENLKLFKRLFDLLLAEHRIDNYIEILGFRTMNLS